MSVWQDAESLSRFVFKSAHVEIMRRRQEWFERMVEAYLVLWWVPKGHVPTVDEALHRLEQLRTRGPTPRRLQLPHGVSAARCRAGHRALRVRQRMPGELNVMQHRLPQDRALSRARGPRADARSAPDRERRGAESPLVLTDITLDDGTVGHSVIFTYTAAALEPTATLVRNFEALVKGDPLAPAETEQKLARRFRLLGSQGLVGMALAAIDMALWDAPRAPARRVADPSPGRRREDRRRPMAPWATTASRSPRALRRTGRSAASPASRPRSAIRRWPRTSP